MPRQCRYGVLQRVEHTEMTDCGGAEPAKNLSKQQEQLKQNTTTAKKDTNKKCHSTNIWTSSTTSSVDFPDDSSATPTPRFFSPSVCARQIYAESFLLPRGEDLSRRSSSSCWGLFFPVKLFDVFTALAKDVKSHGEEK